MSQKNIDFMKKNNYQFKKLLTTPDEQGVVNTIQGLIAGQINTTDTVIDSEMPVDMLTADLNWYEGTPNDNLVKITKGKQIAVKNINDDVIEDINDLSIPFPTGTDGLNIISNNSIIAYDNKIIVKYESGNIMYYDLYLKTWITDGTTGPSTTNLLAGANVFSMIVYDGVLIVGGEGGMVEAYYEGSWHAYNSGDDYTNSGGAVGAYNITSMTEYNGYLIAGGSGTLGSYNKADGWKNHDGTGTGTGVYRMDGFNGQQIESMIEFNGDLIVGTSLGIIESSTTTNVWTDYTGSGGTGIYSAGPNGNNYKGLFEIFEGDLIVYSNNRRVSSVTTANVWSYYDGTGGSGITLPNESTSSNPVFIGTVDSKLVVVNTTAVINSYDTEWHYGSENYGLARRYNTEGCQSCYVYNEVLYLTSIASLIAIIKDTGSDIVNVHRSDNTSEADFINTKILNEDTLGGHTGGANVMSIIKYGDYFVFGMLDGLIVSYHETNETWHTPTSGNGGIFNDSEVVGTNHIYNLEVMNGELFVVSGDRIGTYDGANWKNYDGSGSGTGVYDNSNVLNGSIASTLVWNSNVLVLAGNNGRVGCYHTAEVGNHGFMYYNGTWNGSGDPPLDAMYETGEHSGSCNITAMAEDGNRIVFAGVAPAFGISNWSLSGFTPCFGGGPSEEPYGTQIENEDGWINKIVSTGSDQFSFFDSLHESIFAWDPSGWELSDGTGIGSSLYVSTGSEVGGYMSSMEFGGGMFVIIAGHYGRTASFDGANWKNYDGTGTGSGPYNATDYYTGNANESYYSSIDSTFVFGSTSSEVSSVTGTTWTFPDGTGGGTGVYHDLIKPTGKVNLTTSVVYDNKLIVANYYGEISYYDFTTEAWVAYDSGTGPSNNRTALGLNSYGPVQSMIVYGGILIVAGYDGRIANYNGTVWTNYDGTGGANMPYSDSGVVSAESIQVLIEFDSDLIIIGQNKLGSWNGTAFTDYNGAGGTGIYRTEVFPSMGDIQNAIVYNSNLVLSDSMQGKIMSCDTAGAWRLPDGTGSGGLYYAINTETGMTNYSSIITYGGYIVLSEGEGKIGCCDISNVWTKPDGTGGGLIYSNGGLTGPEIKSIIKYNESSEEGFVIIGGQNEMANFDGAVFHNFESQEMNTYDGEALLGQGNYSVHSATIKGSNIYILRDSESIMVLDTTTGSYSNDQTKITHK